MVQYIVTPWRSHTDLLHVRGDFYPASPVPRPSEKVNERRRSAGVKGSAEIKRHAVDQVLVWVQRGNCPHLVESTAILTSAMLNDVPQNSTYCVRAAYSAAFCRFVTGLLDSHQDRRRKQSMFSIAKALGLPATYVELRHEATHAELPSLTKLRTATQKALRWIWDYYWVHLSGGLEETEDCEAFVRRLLREGNDARREEMEESLVKWDQDQLTEVLMEIQGSNLDTTLLMGAIKLQRLVVEGQTRARSRSSSVAGYTGGTLDKLRAELQRMEGDLDDEDSPENIETGRHTTGLSGKGWALLEGPWVPKPIGIV